MLLESINIAKPVTIQFNNEDISTGIFKTPIEGSVQINSLGVVGDTIVNKKVHGGLDQAIYLYHKEDYDWWSQELGKVVGAGAFGENLTVSGLEDISWLIGDRLKINNVILEITAPRIPCFKLGVRMEDNSVVKKFVKAVRPGAYARVISEGVIQAGDVIEIEKTSKDYASVKDVFTMWYNKNKSLVDLKRILDSPVAIFHREKIQAWYSEMS